MRLLHSVRTALFDDELRRNFIIVESARRPYTCCRTCCQQELPMAHRLLFILFALGLAGCASTPLPHDADSQQPPVILQDADQVGPAVAQAIHFRLQRARVEMAMARHLELEGDRRSEEMWARAKADTDLALGLMREGAVHLAASDATHALGLSQPGYETSTP
jgi:hypothetical protein